MHRPRQIGQRHMPADTVAGARRSAGVRAAQAAHRRAWGHRGRERCGRGVDRTDRRQHHLVDLHAGLDLQPVQQSGGALERFDRTLASTGRRLPVRQCLNPALDAAVADARDDDLGGVVADVAPGHDPHRNRPRLA
ncbi:hypothetical protein NIIDNTM18_49640 [Mycolicibacterium litorale]|uniref:Uncharacterized protein n=1 Tax=Mycolicibacterium litorale TaxID=758802 RepID=A0A6S6PCG5_9MYCO|nr:hypothetical protein NIIDNTM18_49640 [Mycolicibacterium litorale]